MRSRRIELNGAIFERLVFLSLNGYGDLTLLKHISATGVVVKCFTGVVAV